MHHHPALLFPFLGNYPATSKTSMNFTMSVPSLVPFLRKYPSYTNRTVIIFANVAEIVDTHSQYIGGDEKENKSINKEDNW